MHCLIIFPFLLDQLLPLLRQFSLFQTKKFCGSQNKLSYLLLLSVVLEFEQYLVVCVFLAFIAISTSKALG